MNVFKSYKKILVSILFGLLAVNAVIPTLYAVRAPHKGNLARRGPFDNRKPNASVDNVVASENQTIKSPVETVKTATPDVVNKTISTNRTPTLQKSAPLKIKQLNLLELREKNYKPNTMVKGLKIASSGASSVLSSKAVQSVMEVTGIISSPIGYAHKKVTGLIVGKFSNQISKKALPFVLQSQGMNMEQFKALPANEQQMIMMQAQMMTQQFTTLALMLTRNIHKGPWIRLAVKKAKNVLTDGLLQMVMNAEETDEYRKKKDLSKTKDKEYFHNLAANDSLKSRKSKIPEANTFMEQLDNDLLEIKEFNKWKEETLIRGLCRKFESGFKVAGIEHENAATMIIEGRKIAGKAYEVYSMISDFAEALSLVNELTDDYHIKNGTLQFNNGVRKALTLVHAGLKLTSASLKLSKLLKIEDKIVGLITPNENDPAIEVAVKTILVTAIKVAPIAIEIGDWLLPFKDIAAMGYGMARDGYRVTHGKPAKDMLAGMQMPDLGTLTGIQTPNLENSTIETTTNTPEADKDTVQEFDLEAFLKQLEAASGNSELFKNDNIVAGTGSNPVPATSSAARGA